MKPYLTKIDLQESIRAKVIETLNQTLADALDLELQARQAHWNVKGPSFIALHELFARLSRELNGFADDLAERIATLGGVAVGTIHIVAKESRLPRYSNELATGRGHLEALSGSVACFARTAREAVGNVDEAGDVTTADLFTQISRGTDKLLWLLEAHLQAKE